MAGTPSATAKWRARVSANPFSATPTSSILDTEDQQSHITTTETATAATTTAAADEEKEERNDDDDGDDDSVQWQDSTAFFQDVAQQKYAAPTVSFGAGFGIGGAFVGHGKENLAPSRRNIHIYERPGAATPPRVNTVTSRMSHVRPPRAPVTPSKRADNAALSEPFSVLGKRQHEVSSRVLTPRKQLSFDSDLAGDSDATGPVTMVVNDFSSVPHVGFGRVAISDRKTVQLRLENPSALGNARIKYDGCARAPRGKPRFKCDLHVCVVPAESSVLLRITFAPLDDDLERDVSAVLRFTVNDRHRLECRVSGYGVARALKKSRFRGHGAFTLPGASTTAAKLMHEGVLEFAAPRPNDAVTSKSATSQSAKTTSSTSSSATARRAEALAGLKRRESESLVLDMTPPRRPRVKRLRTGDPNSSVAVAKRDGTPSKTGAGRGFAGSWWSQRKVVYDEHWMVKQEEGFTKWMNYVLLDATTQRFMEDDDAVSAPAVTSGAGNKASRRRFDFSSLRVLAQKRIESAWTRAARELFHAPAMDTVAAQLEREVARKKLACRTDRPVYADVGLQAELIALLNNYHPAWLCLGLEAVLGPRAMRDERCSLRSMFAQSAMAAPPPAVLKPSDGGKRAKMPRTLRRIVLQHLVHDPHVARKFRLVKNLKTPMDGSLAPSALGSGRAHAKNLFVNAKTRITGREYFDALTDRFVVKFLLLVKFLDAAAARRRDAFHHFPCLFRVSPSAGATTTTTGSSKRGDEDSSNTDGDQRIKCSQDVVSEFCRLFLASEGRIDKHLRQLGYELAHVQTPLDEIDLQITNLAVDLRDGVRLAKLMEALTASPSTPTPSPVQTTLSRYLRVPALSRLQKVHNIEICLHYLQEKCGADVLESVKSATTTTLAVHAGVRRSRLSASVASGPIQSDEKLVEKLAKDIVDGHREKTLALLWKLISCFQLQSLVDTHVLQREIATIEQRMSFRALEFLEAQQRRAPVRGSGYSDSAHVNDIDDDAAPTADDQVYALLLEWCRAVCANYDVRVSDFTTSFADGRALCYLLHYYHPMLLAKSDIQATTSSERLADVDANAKSDASVDRAQLLANETQHFALVNERVKQLGEVPVLMPQHYHSENPPEEKMVVTFVCYLQSRLMDSSREIHAASRLKRWWLSPWIRTCLRIKRNRSARVIQRFWFTSSHKRLAIRQCRRLLRAAHIVKSVLRMWHARVQFTRLRDAATMLQRAFRLQRLQTSKTKQLCDVAARVLQRQWRHYALAKAEAQRREIEAARQRIARRLRRKASAVTIERWWLGMLQRRAATMTRKARIAQRTLAAQTLQRAWRQRQSCLHARALRQSVWQLEHASARTVQRRWRMYSHRMALLRRVRVTMCAVKVTAALRIVATQRKHARAVALERFQQLLLAKERETKREQLQRRVEHRAATCIQRAYRSFALSTLQHAAAVCIQRVMRGARQRAQYQQLQHRREHAAVRIQSAFRCAVATAQFRCAVASAVMLQRNVRIWRRQRQLHALITFYELLLTYQDMQEDAREHALLRHAAVTCIQTAWRRVVHERWFASTRHCVVTLQRNVRAWRRNRQIAALLRFGRMLQVYRRVRQAKLEALTSRVRHRAASTIQRIVRDFTGRRRHLEAVQAAAAVRVQALARGWHVRRTRCDWYAIKAQLARLRVFTACWRLEWWVAACLQRRRTAQQQLVAATRIMTCWKTHALRCAVADRILRRRRTEQAERVRRAQELAERRMEREREAAAAQAEAERIELAKAEAAAAAEAQRLEELRVQREQEAASAAEARRVEALRVRREMEAAAEARRLDELRLVREQEAAAAATKAEAERIEQERTAAAAAKQAAERQHMEQQRIEREVAAEARRVEELRVEREKQVAAAAAQVEARRQEAERVRREKDELRRLEAVRRESELRMRREKEAAAEALYQEEQRVRREQAAAKEAEETARREAVAANARKRQRSAAASAQQVQSWWRGTLVRRRHRVAQSKPTASSQRASKPQVTASSTVSSSSALVTSNTSRSSSASSAATSSSAVVEPPLTLGARLEMALHLLLHGTRLPEMLFAGHTLEVCTKYSRECCRRCVKLGIPKTLFAAIRGLNRSRPHVELLHQLLLVLEHLTAYERWEQTSAPRLLSAASAAATRRTKSDAAVLDDVRAIEALVDLLHIHRDMEPIFALAAAALQFYVRERQQHRDAFERNASAREIWRDAERRLRGLYELLEKKAAVAAAVARHLPRNSSATASGASRMDPAAAMAMLAQVLQLAE